MILLRKLLRGILSQFYTAAQDPTPNLFNALPQHSLPAAFTQFSRT